jgi:hypothetical protein
MDGCGPPEAATPLTIAPGQGVSRATRGSDSDPLGGVYAGISAPALADRELAGSCEQIAACLLAAATNLGADTAVVMVGRVALALLGASTTCDNAGLDRGA